MEKTIKQKLIDKILIAQSDFTYQETAESIGLDIETVLEIAIIQALDAMNEDQLLELL